MPVPKKRLKRDFALAVTFIVVGPILSAAGIAMCVLVILVMIRYPVQTSSLLPMQQYVVLCALITSAAGCAVGAVRLAFVKMEAIAFARKTRKEMKRLDSLLA